MKSTNIGHGKITSRVCMWSDAEINDALKYLKRRFPKADAYQIFVTGKKDYESFEGIRAMSALEYLGNLV